MRCNRSRRKQKVQSKFVNKNHKQRSSMYNKNRNIGKYLGIYHITLLNLENAALLFELGFLRPECLHKKTWVEGNLLNAPDWNRFALYACARTNKACYLACLLLITFPFTISNPKHLIYNELLQNSAYLIRKYFVFFQRNLQLWEPHKRLDQIIDWRKTCHVFTKTQGFIRHK